MNKIVYRRRSVRGSFTIWDLIAILVIVAFLGGWFVISHTGEHSHIIRCADNLRMLGEATQSYAKDHDDGFPVATINLGRGHVSTWDASLCPYLVPSQTNATSIYDKRKLLQAAQPRFFCPSDPIQRTNPRSYAMSGFDMKLDNWPPSANDRTGVGLAWDTKTVSALLGADIAKEAINNPDILPRLRHSILPEPARTLLLTELIAPRNIMGSVVAARVFYRRQQEDGFNGDSSKFHFGKFNYLMADGHVALKGESETGESGWSQRTGIWVINGGGGND